MPHINGVRSSSPSYLSAEYNVPAPDLNAVEYGQASLRRGMAGESVVKLQRMLVNAGIQVDVDGRFGPQTEAAVRRFQELRGLDVDGVVGSRTMDAFESSFDPARRRPTGPVTPENPVPTVPAPRAPATPDGAAGQYERMALQRHGQAFVDRVHQIAQRIGARPEWMFAVMHNESGMRPDAVNPNGGATGLIQFMPATARGLGTTTAALRNMSAMQQLDYVERYYAPYAGRIRTGADMYLATFYPAAMGRPDDWVLGSQNGTAGVVARANPIFDTNRDGQITAGEFRRYWNNRFPALAS